MLPEMQSINETQARINEAKTSKMMDTQKPLTEMDRLASASVPPESPMTQIMATLLNPNARNLALLSVMFENYVTMMPDGMVPPYVKESAIAFVGSLKKWSQEQIISVPAEKEGA